MAYRAAGYPARYTEGYHLSDMDAQAASDAGEKEVILTTKNAHAWVEVYIAGLGWMPVEVVTGLYTETYTDQLKGSLLIVSTQFVMKTVRIQQIRVPETEQESLKPR